MKKFKVTAKNVVFSIGKTDYIGKEGDILELPEDYITTRALVERKRIEEVTEDETPTETEPIQDTSTKKPSVKSTKK